VHLSCISSTISNSSQDKVEKKSLQKSRKSDGGACRKSLAHVLNRHEINFLQSSWKRKGHERNVDRKQRYLIPVSLNGRIMWKAKECGIEASQNRGYSTCGQMSNPHDINLGIKILIIEARGTEGSDRIGTCRGDNRQTLNNADEKKKRKGRSPSSPSGQVGQANQIFFTSLVQLMGSKVLESNCLLNMFVS